MLSKTLRSVLSLVLVFGLLLGMSGNAIALAVDDPVGDAIDQIDKEVNTIIGELEDTIADLEEEVENQEQNLANAKEELANGKEELAEAKKILDEKKVLLEEAKAELDALQSKLNEADEMLGKLEEKAAEYQAQLDDAQKQLDDAKAKLDDAQKQLDDAWTQYDAAAAELEAAELELQAKQDAYDQAIADGVPAEMLNDVKDQLDAAWATYDNAEAELNNALDQLTKASIDLDEAEVKLAEAQDQKDDYQAKLDEAMTQLEKAKEQVAWAKGEYQKIYGTIDEIETTMNNYQAKADEADAAVVKAEEVLPKAETALVEAKEALADAKALVANVKATYSTLRNAVLNPEASVDFVSETVDALSAQINALWDSMLKLQTSLHELIAAYEELEGFSIDPIVIEDYYFAGLVIEPFEVGEYHYEEANFHFYGYKFDGYTVDPVTVEGYTFEGFTAPAMPSELIEISELLDSVIAEVTSLTAALSYYVAVAEEILAEAQDYVEGELNFTVDFVKEHLNEKSLQEIYDWLYNNPATVCDMVEEFGIYALELLVEYGPYAMDLLEEHYDLAVLGAALVGTGIYAGIEYANDVLKFLADYEDDIYNVARDLYEEYGDEAEALIEVYVDYLQLRERYDEATYSEYTVFHDSLYVAIGDGTALPGGYTDKLAELMGIGHMTENLAQIDLTVKQAIDLVKENAELIGKADLITLGFSNIPASVEVMNILTKDQNYDWTGDVNSTFSERIDEIVAELKDFMIEDRWDDEYLDMVDEAVEMIEDALAELDKRLNEEGLDEPTVNLIVEAVEAYGVAYLSRMAWYPVLVDTVRDANPDALIVLVGTYNDLEGVTVDVRGEKIDIGEYTQYLIGAANLENLAQAFFSENVIYADAYKVETVFEENAYEELNNLGCLMSILNDEMLPSEAGHQYIADRIYSALNVKYEIWGDVNGDRKVNCRDARLILQYTAGLITEDDLDLTWADVNGDGKVNSRDARLILQLRAGQIEHFPVCNLSEE